MKTGATISACGKYRYRLWREWDDLAPLMIFCMLNPSTADASVDDPTIRRCIGYARRERHGGIVVVNVFAYRATDPKELLRVEDPCGPENLEYLSNIRRSAGLSTLVAAWGAPKGGRRLVDHYHNAKFFMREHGAKCLGVNKDGSPKHPLYVKSDALLVMWGAP